MNINMPKASVGLGTSGIGDNFARARLLMAQKAGYIQSTPSPYAQPGTALKAYQGAVPLLHQMAQAQGQQHGIPGLLRQGMQGRPPGPTMAPMGQPTPMVNFSSDMLGHSTGNPWMGPGQFNFMAAQPPTPAPTGPAIRGGLSAPTQWGGPLTPPLPNPPGVARPSGFMMPMMGGR